MQRRSFSRDFYVALVIVVVAGAAIGGLIVYLRATAPPDEQTYIPRPAVITPEIKLLQQYIRIDTTNPPGRELGGARFLMDQLADAGVKAELIESAPGRANVYARLRGQQPGEGLLLIHHIDVAPADTAAWTRPPFGGEIDLNQLWGRGSLDMKGIGICHLRAFVELAQSGIPLQRDLVFLATADEEAEGKLGTAWLLRHRPDIFEGIRYALNEGGITEMQAEQLTLFGVEIGSKQFMKVALSSESRQKLEQARIALEPHIDPFDPERLLPEVRDFFKAVAPYRVQGRDLLEDVVTAIEQGEFWRLNSSFRGLTQNTIMPGGIHPQAGGFGLEVYLHNLPDEQPQHALARLRAIIKPFALREEALITMGPTRISSTETDLFRLIAAAVKQVYGPQTPVGPLILPYQTNDSRYLRAQGIDSYGVLPFLADFHQTQGIHGPNERVRLDWFMQGMAVISQIVRSYCL